MKICIIDDHRIIIEGIELLLSFEKQIEILKTYEDGNDLFQDIEQSTIFPDIVLMDLYMPNINGIDCSKLLKSKYPSIKIIVLSMNCEDHIVHELIDKIGVDGYLSKKINRKELTAALQLVESGGRYLSNEAEAALQRFKKKIIDYPVIKLSTREKEIVQLMIDGLMNKEIAAKLFISESTVETHRKNIYRKTEAHSLPKLIQMVTELNLLDDFN